LFIYELGVPVGWAKARLYATFIAPSLPRVALALAVAQGRGNEKSDQRA